MNKEESIKKKLYGLWEKEYLRITTFSGEKIVLGLGQGRWLDQIENEQAIAADMDEVWETIESFGIPISSVKELKPSHKEIFEIYTAIKAYRVGVKYLRMLKDKMGGSFGSTKHFE